MTRSPAEPILSGRALNRALLARQHLIERRRAGALEEVEHLVGMQAQIPNAPYVGLWSRLEGFDATDLSTLIEKRRAVRLGMMRNTLHLVSSRDCLRWWTLFQPLFTQRFRGSSFARALPGVSLDRVVAEANRILETGPLTLAQLGNQLSRRFSGPTDALAYVIRFMVPIIQVPPRGVWGKSGQATWTTAQLWLGKAPEEKPSLESFVMRYLAAFGPATVSDVTSWSGLTGLRPVVERLRDRLMTFRDEKGRQLFDISTAPRPDPRSPVPPRFLPEFDNVLLGHEDRTRVIAFEHRHVILNGTFLLDGRVAGIWRIRKTKNESRLTVSSFDQLTRLQRKAVGEEAERLLGFAAPGARAGVEFVVAPAPTSFPQRRDAP